MSIVRKQAEDGVRLVDCRVEENPGVKPEFDEQFCFYSCAELSGRLEKHRVLKKLAEHWIKGKYSCLKERSRSDVASIEMEQMIVWASFFSLDHLKKIRYLRKMGMLARFSYRTMGPMKVTWKNGFMTNYPFILPSGFHAVGVLNGMRRRQGFLAVKPNKQMVISFRGTSTDGEWAENGRF